MGWRALLGKSCAAWQSYVHACAVGVESSASRTGLFYDRVQTGELTLLRDPTKQARNPLTAFERGCLTFCGQIDPLSTVEFFNSTPYRPTETQLPDSPLFGSHCPITAIRKSDIAVHARSPSAVGSV